MKQMIRLILLSSLTAMTAACASVGGQGVAAIPKKPFSDGAVEVIANKYLDAVTRSGTSMPVAKAGSWLDFYEKCRDHVTANNSVELVKCRNFRDLVINDLMFIINHNYSAYEGKLLAGRANSDFYVGATRSAFETGATLIDATGVKTVLSALATFTGSTQTLANEAFYYEQTGPALINAMRADRKTAHLPILAGMKSEYKDYPLTAAMADLDAYFRAGTIASAVIALSKTTANAEEEATSKLQCATKALTATDVRTC